LEQGSRCGTATRGGKQGGRLEDVQKLEESCGVFRRLADNANVCGETAVPIHTIKDGPDRLQEGGQVSRVLPSAQQPRPNNIRSSFPSKDPPLRRRPLEFGFVTSEGLVCLQSVS